jgi:hypothetical protein
VITVTEISVLGLSHPFRVWLTYQLNVPAAAVDGMGAPADPIPPVAVVYHNRF